MTENNSNYGRNHKPTYPRSSMNHMQNKHNKNHIKTHHNRIAGKEIAEQILKVVG